MERIPSKETSATIIEDSLPPKGTEMRANVQVGASAAKALQTTTDIFTAVSARTHGIYGS